MFQYDKHLSQEQMQRVNQLRVRHTTEENTERSFVDLDQLVMIPVLADGGMLERYIDNGAA